jgi:hypothetical protein
MLSPGQKECPGQKCRKVLKHITSVKSSSPRCTSGDFPQNRAAKPQSHCTKGPKIKEKGLKQGTGGRGNPERSPAVKQAERVWVENELPMPRLHNNTYPFEGEC